MDIGAILIGLAIAVAAAVYVMQPLRRRSRLARSLAPSPRQRLEADYRATLDAIRELDFDFQTGKVLEEDYRPLRERYVAQGVALLKEMEQLELQPHPHREAAGTTSDEIEAMVQARRKRRAARAGKVERGG